MARLLAIALLAAVALVCGAAAFYQAPIFKLDLSKPPQHRWDGAVDLVLSQYNWSESFGVLLNVYNATEYAHVPVPDREVIRQVVQSRFPVNYIEMIGIDRQFAVVGHPEVDMHFLTYWVWFHEIAHASDFPPMLSTQEAQASGLIDDVAGPIYKECTGILVVPSNKTEPLIHGRNLDQSPLRARRLALQIEVYNGTGPLLYQAVCIYWMTSGFVTALKVGGIGLEENWRFNDSHPAQPYKEIFKRIAYDSRTIPQVFMYRILMEKIIVNDPPYSHISFQKAVSFLSTTLFAAPFYGIVSGYPRVGAVLSVSYNQSYTRIEYLNKNGEADNGGRWYMVQTNYDRWQPDPAYDNRRTVADDALKTLGRVDGGTRLGVYMAISTYPVHNENTFFTLLMQIDRPTRAFIRVSLTPTADFPTTAPPPSQEAK